MSARLDRAGMSGRQLVLEAKISPDTVGQIVRGVQREPRRETLEALSTVMGVSVEQLRRTADATDAVPQPTVTITTDPERGYYLRRSALLTPDQLACLDRVRQAVDQTVNAQKRDLERRERGDTEGPEAVG